MAEETEKSGEKLPVFKADSAFDRAKYNKEFKETQGRAVDPNLLEQMKDTQGVINEAVDFYYENFNKQLKAIDPSYDPGSIFYEYAYADQGSDTRQIKSKIDKGEAIDGKEIIEFASSTAQNKISNANILKTGKVTQIVENIGIGDIKKMESFSEVKSDFDSKVKNDSLKFDSLLSGFEQVLSYFNDQSPNAGQIITKVATPENVSIISALAKILESEGFNSDSVKEMSKRYEENLGKLIDKSNSGSIESMKMTKEGDVVKSTGEGVTEEKKLEEKKEETPASPPPVAPVEEPKVAPVEPAVEAKTTEVGSTGPVSSAAETKLEETKSGTGPTETAGSTVKSEPAKIDSVSRDSKVNSMIKDLFGIDLSATGGTGGTGGTGETGKGESEAVKLAAKKADDLFSSPKGDVGSTGGTGGTGGKEPEKKKEETKLETKIDKKNEKINETLPVSTGKIETTAQNLSSVSAPVEKPKEAEPTATNTSTTSNTSSNEGSSGTTTTESPKSETTNNEKKVEDNKKEGEDNKEMLETMKNMVSLLTQLNSTMQGPLIVTPTNKKF